MKREIIFRRWITIEAIRGPAGDYPAMEWFDSLEHRDRMRAVAGMANFNNTEEAGIRGTGRVSAVKGRQRTMLELKLRRGGSTGSQLRMLGVLRGRTFYAALGFHKTTKRIPRSEIKRAQAILEVGLPHDDADREGKHGHEP